MFTFSRVMVFFSIFVIWVSPSKKPLDCRRLGTCSTVQHRLHAQRNWPYKNSAMATLCGSFGLEPLPRAILATSYRNLNSAPRQPLGILYLKYCLQFEFLSHQFFLTKKITVNFCGRTLLRQNFKITTVTKFVLWECT